jgi:isopentenyl phosphate kinase
LVRADFVIKLGGSAITHKDSTLSPNVKVMKQIARELAKFDLEEKKIVLVYGGGSFGHSAASKYLSKGVIFSPKGCAEVRAAMLSLTKILTDMFLKYGLPIFVINPSSSFLLKDGEITIEGSFLTPIERSLQTGLLPAVGGDVVLDSVNGARILSGDRIARLIAVRLKAKALVFGTDVDGILADRRLLRKIKKDDIKRILAGLCGRPGDVTGGMAGKLREVDSYLSEGGHFAIIFNITHPGLLTKILSGDEVIGTYIG